MRGVVGLLSLISNLFYAYTLVLIVYALMSWLPGARESQFGQLIGKLARPYLDIFDQLIPPIGGISFNIMIAVLCLQFIERGLIWLISLILL